MTDLTTRQPVDPAARVPATMGLKSLWKQVATTPLIAVVVMVVVLVSTFLITAGPRLIDSITDRALQAGLADALPANRNLEGRYEGTIESMRDTDRFREIREMGDEFATAIPESIGSVTSGSAFYIESPQFEVGGRSGTTVFTFRHLEGMHDRIRLVSGSMPSMVPAQFVWLDLGDPSLCPDTTPGPDNRYIETEDGRVVCFVGVVHTFETAISQVTADRLGLGIGDEVVIEPMSSGGYFGGYRTLIRVSGVIEVLDPDDEFWFGDTRLAVPDVIEDLDLDITHAAGVFSENQYALMTAISESGARWSYRFRHFIDPGQVTTRNAEQILDDLRFLLATQTVPAPHTGLLGVIGDVYDQRSRAMSTLSMSLFGLFALSLGLVWLLASLMSAKNHGATVLVRSRGASRVQVSASQVVVAVAMTLPAVVIAYLAALVVIPDGGTATLWMAVGIAVTTPAMFLIASRRVTHEDIGKLQRGLPVESQRQVRQLVAEALLIVLALGALGLTARRAFTRPDADLLAAATLTLLVMAAGLVMLRLVAVPIAWGNRLVTRRSGPAGFLGLRRMRQQVRVSKMPVLVVLLAVAVAVFSHVVRLSLNQSDTYRTFQTVGADHRVVGNYVGQNLDGVPDFTMGGVEAVAGANRLRARAPAADEVGFIFHELLSIDGPDYQIVVDGTPADPGLPEFITDPESTGAFGTVISPLPAIVSSLGIGGGETTVGQVFTLEVGVHRPVLVVSEIRDSFPGVPDDSNFVVVERSAMIGVGATTVRPITDIFVRGQVDPDGFEQVLRAHDLRGISQAQLYASLRAGPFAQAIDTGLLALTFTIAVLAALAAVAYVTLTEPSRTRDLGYMRTMGMSEARTTRTALVEVSMPLVFAAAIGVGLGYAATYLLSRILRLDMVAPPSPWSLLIALVCFLIVATLPVTALAKRGAARDLTRILKTGDE